MENRGVFLEINHVHTNLKDLILMCSHMQSVKITHSKKNFHFISKVSAVEQRLLRKNYSLFYGGHP
jgi:hypothetical protein